MTHATLHTTHGAIQLELFDEDAPKTVRNFVTLAGDGFYDGITFHRLIPDFMIQGGCPRGDGTGGPGYEFQDEPNARRVVRGALAMANRGPDTNGSQFFIVTAESCPWLDGKHTVFGQVEAGMDVVDAISELPRDASDRPREPVAIERKKQVRQKLKEKKKQDVLHSFWKTPDGSLYAIVQADNVDDVWDDIDGKKKMEMEDVPD